MGFTKNISGPSTIQRFSVGTVLLPHNEPRGNLVMFEDDSDCQRQSLLLESSGQGARMPKVLHTWDSLEHQTFVPPKMPFKVLLKNHKKHKQFSSCLHELMKILFVQDSCKSRDYWVCLGYKLPEGLNCW